MRYEVKLPSLGDDDDAVDGGEISMWLVRPGADVAEGADLLELTTDKAAFTLPAPRAGKLVETLVREGDAVRVGDTLCVLEVEQSA
ncbi:MAG: lipoyl domain-containing protein [Candidatus Hydrogenedentes bacterium]|nr:lipoyl domain-containing protein [Candidatus Hydrogenedentota bacterium]